MLKSYSLKEWRAVAAGTFNCLQEAARPFDASDPTMCLYEMTFLPMTGRTSAAVGRARCSSHRSVVGQRKESCLLPFPTDSHQETTSVNLRLCRRLLVCLLRSGSFAGSFCLCRQLPLVDRFLLRRCAAGIYLQNTRCEAEFHVFLKLCPSRDKTNHFVNANHVVMGPSNDVSSRILRHFHRCTVDSSHETSHVWCMASSHSC